MANPNDIINRLLAGGGANSLASTVDQLSGGGTSEAFRGLAAQLDQLRGLFQAQTASTKENTEALTRATNTGASQVASSVSNVAKSAGTALTGGLLLSPLLSGVLKLFGRDRSPEPPASMPSFSLPRSLAIDGTLSSARGITPTQYAQDGLPRAVTPPPRATTQVTVQVQAMDARSFLDRSDDIARAVKEAMLNSHSVNDVIGEL